MDAKTQHILKGNLKKGLPKLYNKEANNVYELHDNFEELREAVAKELTPEVMHSQGVDYLNWDYISCWRKMTEEELRQFKDFVNWNLIKEYQLQYLSDDFRREFKEYLS